MKNLPVFTTEYGVATLILKEIPYQETAYIILQDTLEPLLLVRECADFCRACGAERIYARGNDALAEYPFFTAMWEMTCLRESIQDTDAALWPVQERTLTQWQEIYNQKVKTVPNGAWMTDADAKDILSKGEVSDYIVKPFVHEAVLQRVKNVLDSKKALKDLIEK